MMQDGKVVTMEGE